MKTRSKKRVVKFLSILCIIALCSVLMGAAPDHIADFYVNDYADILSTEAEEKIVAIGDDLCDETKAQVVVLTVESLEGQDISEYSVETFRAWGIGDEAEDNGVLIVFSLNDREMWVTVGYGLEGTLTDARVGYIRDKFAMPYYKENQFETGTVELYSAIVNYIRTEEYGLEPLTGYETMDIDAESDSLLDLVAPLFVFLPVIAIGLHSVFSKIKYNYLLRYDQKHGTHRAFDYRKKLRKYCKAMQNTDANTTRRHYRSGGFYFGGGGGYRGGGGGFGGGGGSTGGGGAGGSF